MAKFSIQITRVDEYEIEVDENIWTSEEIAAWAKTFFPASDPEDIAKHLAYSIMRNGSAAGFMEGWGYVKAFRPDGSLKSQLGKGFKSVKEEDYSKGLSVTVISEDDDYDHEITRKD